jgi:steroid delta-isomerase
MEVEDKIAAVHKYVEAFASGNMDIIRELYAEDAVVEDPVGTDPYIGIDAIQGFYEPSLGSGVKLELSGTPRCAGNAVAFPFRAVIGEMTIEIVDVFEFNEAGKVVSMKAYWGPENMV